MARSPRTRRLERGIAAIRAQPQAADHPPSRGTTLDVDGRTYSVSPASIRVVRAPYDRQIAYAASKTEDDAWLVISPDGSILALIVGRGRHWSIYRRADGAPWRRGEDAEISYYRGIEDGWASVVTGIVRLTI